MTRSSSLALVAVLATAGASFAAGATLTREVGGVGGRSGQVVVLVEQDDRRMSPRVECRRGGVRMSIRLTRDDVKDLRVHLAAAAGKESRKPRSSAMTDGNRRSKVDVAKVIRRKNSSIRRCYEAALKQRPRLEARITVTFTVGTKGKVTSVRTAGATGEFAECIRRKFLRIRGLPLLSVPNSFNQSYVFTWQ